MLRLAFLAVVLTGAVLTVALPAQAQSFGALSFSKSSDVVTWRVGSNHGARGGEASVVIRAEIADGWHLYAIGSPVGRPLEVELSDLPAGAAWTEIFQSNPHQGTDPGLGVPYLYFSEEARVEVPVTLSQRAALGRHTVRGTLRYATCNDSICLPPSTTRFSVPIVVR